LISDDSFGWPGKASRFFKDEVRWKTPLLTDDAPDFGAGTGIRKVAGALIGTLRCWRFCGGVILVPDKSAIFSTQFPRTCRIRDAGGVVLQFILFLHLTTFLSLVINGERFPAIAIQ